eukprot:XP_016656065.1 PREDICTED: uncharacterized protein LOC103307748 [Acyrthosiphon pisum]
MRHARRRSLPRLPNSLLDLATLFDNGQLNRFSCCESPFFRGCVRDVDGRSSIIFGCMNLIANVLQHGVTELHADATFKVVPSNMGYQLLTIHCMIENHSIPIVYILMESKSRNSYDCVMRFVKDNLLPNLTVEVIITDYEVALRDVLISSFPGARYAGCWFHHNQAVWRKMNSLGYLHHLNTNDNARKVLKLLMSLPLLPARDMENGYLLIRAFARNHDVHLERLLSYYERYWLRSIGPQVVSVHGLPRRTNNNIESFHNALRLKFSVAHPSLWVFLDALTSLSTSYHLVNQQILNHLRPTRHVRTKFLANSHRIKYATEQYQLGQISIWQFLLRCSYTSAAYELRQRTWALRMHNADVDAESDHNVPADEVPVPDHIPNVIDPQPMENNDLQLDLNQPFYNAPGSPPIMNPPDSPNVPQPPDNRNLCMTCLVVSLAESEQQYIVLPCGHAWVCDGCVRQLEQQNSVCPMCRAENVIFQRVFFS